jgi:hypothetical protein
MHLPPRPHLAPLLLALLLLALAVGPAAASAQLQTIDFESGPALGTPVDSVGEVSFPHGPGFRPYRVDVGARAKSGTTVGDVGRCVDEFPQPGGCEFFHAGTVGRLARTADRVTVFAGVFNPDDPAEVATLTALRADGTVADSSGPVAIDAAGFDQQLSVTSAAGDIASFKVESSTPDGAPAGDLGIDDVRVSFADGAKPDFSVSAPSQVVALVQGQRAELPIELARVNGSDGPVEVSVTGLPQGVSASVAPNPIPGGQTSATLTLEAAADAPDTQFVPSDATIEADPLGNADVGPAARRATLSVRVAANFGLAIGGSSDTNLPPGGRVAVEAPYCAPVELPLRIGRDIANDQDVSLSIKGDSPQAIQLPPGIEGEFLPDAVVHPGGALSAERTLRLRAGDAAFIPADGARLVIEGKAGTSTHTLPLRLLRATPHASIVTDTPGSGLGLTPRFAEEGTHVRIHGNGFCPATSVKVGDTFAPAPARVIDAHTLEFTVPRYATSGRVTIVPAAGLPSYETSDALTVDNFRNTDAFQFHNFSGGDLSLAEFTEAFSSDIFIKVNLCWPFGDCPVPTGILHPVAALEWGVFDQISGAEGHCYGMALGSNDLRSGRVPYSRLVTQPTLGAPDVYDVPAPEHPSASAGSFIEVEHVKQYSDEFIRAYSHRETGLDAQLRTLETEFSHNRTPIVSIKNEGEFNGHVLLAYDLTQTSTGADIYVWDTNRNYEGNEDFSAVNHHRQVDGGVIHIDKVGRSWTYTMVSPSVFMPDVWEGGDDGTLWIQPQGTLPEQPTLPGLGTLGSFIESVAFGSAGGSVRTVGGSAAAEYIPAADGRSRLDAPTNGTWIDRDPRQPLAVRFLGTEDGAYSESYSAPGFAAAAINVATEKGVGDVVKGDGDSLRIASGERRPLRLEAAREGHDASLAATVATTASEHGSDSVGFAAGALTYAHDGAPTTARFTLTEVRRDGGPSTFVSGPVAVGGGERLSLRPVGRGMSRVRVVIRGANGAMRTRLLRNRGAAHRRLRLSRPRLAGRRLAVGFRLGGVRGRAFLGASLRLMRGHRVLARRSLSQRAEDVGSVHWRLPRRLAPGPYRLVVDARAVSVGGRGLTAVAKVSGHRATAIQLGR